MRNEQPIASRAGYYMRASLQFSAWLVAALSFTVSAQAPARDPRIGAWTEKPGPGSSGIQTRYDDLGDGRVAVHLTGLVVNARCDGTNYPFVRPNGQPAGPTYACRITGPRTVEYTYTQPGRIPWTTSAGIDTVSEDGNTLTHVGVRRDATGAFIENLSQTFERVKPAAQ